jgi:hypothetical protein
MQRAVTLKVQLQELLFMHLKLNWTLFMHLKLNWTLFMHHEIELDAINCLLLTPVLYESGTTLEGGLKGL